MYGYLEFTQLPSRLIATGSILFPKGAMAIIVSRRPIINTAGQLLGWQPFSRFVLNQDTGGAILGPQRVDLYFGSGAEAEAAAGFMNSQGKVYFLVLKGPSGPQPRPR